MPRKPEMTLKRYSEFSPTAFDAKGLALEKQQDWLVCPVSITRDTQDPLTLSNWETFREALKAIDPEGADHETHRFGHWGPGWFEIVIVRPDTACAVEAQELANALESYPVLNDEDYSRREWDMASESFDRYELADLADSIGEAFGLKPRTVERLKEMKPETVLDWALDAIGYQEIRSSDEGSRFIFERITEDHKLTREALARFLFSNRRTN